MELPTADSQPPARAPSPPTAAVGVKREATLAAIGQRPAIRGLPRESTSMPTTAAGRPRHTEQQEHRSRQATEPPHHIHESLQPSMAVPIAQANTPPGSTADVPVVQPGPAAATDVEGPSHTAAKPAGEASTLAALTVKQEALLLGRKSSVSSDASLSMCRTSSEPSQKVQPSRGHTPKVVITQMGTTLRTPMDDRSEAGQSVTTAGSTVNALQVNREAVAIDMPRCVALEVSPSMKRSLLELPSLLPQAQGQVTDVRNGASPPLQGMGSSGQTEQLPVVQEGERVTESHESVQVALKVTSSSLPQTTEADQFEGIERCSDLTSRGNPLARLVAAEEQPVKGNDIPSVIRPMAPSPEAITQLENCASTAVTAGTPQSTAQEGTQREKDRVAVAMPSDPSLKMQKMQRGAGEVVKIPSLMTHSELGEATTSHESIPGRPREGVSLQSTLQAEQVPEREGHVRLSSERSSLVPLVQLEGEALKANERSTELSRDAASVEEAFVEATTRQPERKSTATATTKLCSTEVRISPFLTSSTLPTRDPAISPATSSKEQNVSQVTIPVAPSLSIWSPVRLFSSTPIPVVRDPCPPIPHVPALPSAGTEKTFAKSDPAPDAKVKPEDVFSLSTPVPLVATGGPDSEGRLGPSPKAPLGAQCVKQEASKLAELEECKLKTEGVSFSAWPSTSPSIVTASRTLGLSSSNFPVAEHPSTLLDKDSSKPNSTMKSCGTRPQPSAEPSIGLCSIGRRIQVVSCGPTSSAHSPLQPNDQPFPESVKQEAAIVEDVQMSSMPATVPTMAVRTASEMPSSSKFLEGSSLKAAQIQSCGPVSPAVKQEARSIQECPGSSILRNHAHLVDPPTSSDSRTTVHPTTDETGSSAQTAPSGSTLNKRVLTSASRQRLSTLTLKPLMSMPLVSIPPSSLPQTSAKAASAPPDGMGETPALSSPSVPILPRARVLTPYVSTPHVSTTFIQTPSVPTSNVSTPRVSTPFVPTPRLLTAFVSTPSVTVPFVSTPSVLAPLVSSPSVSSCHVPTSSEPSTLPQVQASAITSQHEVRVTRNASQAAPIMYAQTPQTLIRSIPYGSENDMPGLSQQRRAAVISSQKTACISIAPAPCAAASFGPTCSVQDSPNAAMRPLAQRISTFPQPTRTPTASYSSNPAVFTNLQQNTSSSTCMPVTSASGLGQAIADLSTPVSPALYSRPSMGQSLSQTASIPGLSDLMANMRPPPTPPRQCVRCGVANSRLRRTGPDGFQTLCNSCGLQYEHQNMIVYEDNVSGRISAAEFPGSRPMKVIGFHTRGFFADVSRELIGAVGAYRRPPRDFSRPIVVPLNVPGTDPIEATASVPANQILSPSSRLQSTGRAELANGSSVPPIRRAVGQRVREYPGSQEELGVEPPTNDGDDTEGNALETSPTNERWETPVHIPEVQRGDGPSEAAATTPFTRFVRRRRNRSAESNSPGVNAQNARDPNASEQSADVQMVNTDADAFDVDAIDISTVDVDSADDARVDQEVERDSERSTDSHDGEGKLVGSVGSPGQESAAVVCVFSKSEDPAPDPVRRSGPVTGHDKRLIRRCRSLGLRENVIDMSTRTLAGCDHPGSPRGSVKLVDYFTRHGVTGSRSGKTSLVNVCSTRPRVTEQRRSRMGAEQCVSVLGRLLDDPGDCTHNTLRSNQSLEQEANTTSDESIRLNPTKASGSSSTSVMLINAAEDQGSPCSGVGGTRQNTGQKRRRSGLALQGHSVRQKLQAWEGSCSEIDDSCDDLTQSPGVIVCNNHRRRLEGVLQLSHVEATNTGTDKEHLQPRVHSVKAEYRSMLHRLAIPNGISFLEFKTKLQDIFQVTERIALQYKDNEDDYITITSDSDMEELFVVVRQYSLSPIRVRICDEA